jgi:hypothetical protein
VTAPEQAALFDVPAAPKRKTWAQRLDEVVPLYAPGEPRPWDEIDEADRQLGWERRYVDHRRAVEVRRELADALGSP